MSSRVLVVDDDPEVRQLARLLLEREGLEVDDAADAETALTKLKEREPNIVVLDHRLSTGVTGLEIAALVHRARPWCCIVMFSAFLETDARYPGVDAVINKSQFGDLGSRVAAVASRV